MRFSTPHSFPWLPRRATAVLCGILILCLGLCLSLGGPAAAAGAETRKADLVVVYKGLRRMKLLNHGEILHEYRIALGRKPVGPKDRAGDDRTPEGVYRIDGRNARSNFHRSLHISFPNEDDVKRARTLGVQTGDAIMIHGIANDYTECEVGHPVVNWTAGCIAVTNREIDEIWGLVDDGTAILILP
jgi:murein L,D-transpeptidase YafK